MAAQPNFTAEKEDFDASKDTLIIYTSGTTGPPKGVVHTGKSLKAQTEAIAKAWNWTAEVDILCFDFSLFFLYLSLAIFLYYSKLITIKLVG